MSPIALEWFEKAEADFATAKLIMRAWRRKRNYDMACFHMQQCAEKYMKGILQEKKYLFSKTHNLEELLALVVTIAPLWEAVRIHTKKLTEYAVKYRYPGENVEKEEAKLAWISCKVIRDEARKLINLEYQ